MGLSKKIAVQEECYNHETIQPDGSKIFFKSSRKLPNKREMEPLTQTLRNKAHYFSPKNIVLLFIHHLFLQSINISHYIYCHCSYGGVWELLKQFLGTKMKMF